MAEADGVQAQRLNMCRIEVIIRSSFPNRKSDSNYIVEGIVAYVAHIYTDIFCKATWLFSLKTISGRLELRILLKSKREAHGVLLSGVFPMSISSR
jgi:hypothetical protein